MVEEHTKNKVLMIEAMFAIMLMIFIGAFALNKYLPTAQVPTGGDVPGIVGFVPVEIKSHPLDITATDSRSFVLFSEKDDHFNLTSLRLSGSVIGEGRAEIVIDNGLGQELLVYSNIKNKQGNLITGMAVGDEEEPLPEGVPIVPEEPASAWLKISPEEGTLNEQVSIVLSADKKTVPGEFDHSCRDTCYMNMKMQKGLYYTIKIRLDAGTSVNINDMKYTMEV